VSRLRVRVAPHEAGLRLEALVARRLAERFGRPLARSAVRRLLIAGAARLDGRPLRRPGLLVEGGWRLEIDVDAARLAPRGDVDVVLTAAEVLFLDPFLLALVKPPGIPCVPTADPSRPSLVRAAEALLRQGGQRPYVAVHQRLDRDTSGVVLFARDPRANAGLAAAFAARRVEKRYLALTARAAGPLPDRFEARGPIQDQPALTVFRVRARYPRGLLIEARPHTGRKHQIRIHLAGAGVPVLGDARHGGPPAPRTMLHAWRLALAHPVTGAALRLECAPPLDFRTAQAGLAPRAARLRRRRPAANIAR
jgi:23S rRNA pseudouridine1911/1915/1917 synthase